MSLLKGLAIDKNEEIGGEEQDSLGAGGVFDSGVYDFKIKLAYMIKSTGGAVGVALQLVHNGRTLNKTVYCTNKQGQPYYERDGKKNYLPGFNFMNAMGLLAAGEELSDLETEDKIIKVYDFDESKEVPKNCEVITSLVGEDIMIGVIKQIVDKNTKNDNFDPTQPKGPENQPYIPTGETREENELDKVFQAESGMTVAELRAEADEAKFIDEWKAKWDGVTRNRAKGAANGQGLTGAGATAGGPQTTEGRKKKLFGKKSG